MKTALQGKSFPQTFELLRGEGLILEDNEIYIRDEELLNETNENKKRKKSKLILKFKIEEEILEYKFTSSVNSIFQKEKHLKEKEPKFWFKLIRKITETLAQEIELKEIRIKSGRKDKELLIKNGYHIKDRYIYIKKIKTE